ncbi:MAG: glycerol dehydrogenase [Burkholderiaceae bacterium]|nr:glycerol dehydrogenase [Burkholderiaceae bacterium]
MRIYGGPRRYIQGPDALQQLEVELRRFGSNALLLADEVVEERLALAVDTRLVAGACVRFGGECTEEEIARVAQVGTDRRCDVVVGAGGGKALDVAKAVAHELGTEVVIVPTIASNDAATSRLSVLYDKTHRVRGVRRLDLNPALVLVDTKVIIAAPRRFFVAGIGDALSKVFESDACRTARGRSFFDAEPPLAAQALADACYRTLRSSAARALDALARGTPDQAFEDTTEAAVLLSGLAFENGGLSVAHALTRGFTAVPQLATSLHGEQVSVGLVVQLILADTSASDLGELIAFMRSIGLPTSMRDLAIEPIDESEIAKTVAAVTLSSAQHLLRHFHRPLSETNLRQAIVECARL